MAQGIIDKIGAMGGAVAAMESRFYQKQIAEREVDSHGYNIVTRTMRVRMPHRKLKWEMPVLNFQRR